jgi:hypothetical protein
MPGVLMLEALAQAAALLSFESMGQEPDDDTVVYFVGIDNARFKRPGGAGRPADPGSRIDRAKAGIYKYKTRASGGRRGGRRGRPDVHHAQGGLSRAGVWAWPPDPWPTAIVDPAGRAGETTSRWGLRRDRRRTCDRRRHARSARTA